MKILAGNPGKRPIGKEPQPPAWDGGVPAHLTGVAREEWVRVMAVLDKMGVFTAADKSVLEAYCIGCATFREATEELRKKGQVVKTPFGPARNPWAKVQKEAWTMMEKAGSKLGLSPVDRAKLAVSPSEDPDDPDKEFFGDPAAPRTAARRPEASA